MVEFSYPSSLSLLYHLSSTSYGPLSIPRAHEKDGGPAANFNYIRCQCLSWLLNNPWFERVWIVQEVALPRVVYIVYSGQYLDWNVLAEAAKSFVGPQGLELTEVLQSTHMVEGMLEDLLKTFVLSRKFDRILS